MVSAVGRAVVPWPVRSLRQSPTVPLRPPHHLPFLIRAWPTACKSERGTGNGAAPASQTATDSASTSLPPAEEDIHTETDSLAPVLSSTEPEAERPPEAYSPPGGAGPSHRAADEVPQGNGAVHTARRQPLDASGASSQHARRGSSLLVRLSKDGPIYTNVEDKGPSALLTAPEKPVEAGGRPDLGTFWGLLILGLAYVHHSTTGFALPALLPLISSDMQLTDAQGSLLTAGYTVLYALALVPVGFLADKADRPRLLAGGLVVWSVLTMVASKVNGFGELLATRILFAAAQATQNPICFSLIPELFRKDRTTAMAAYNSAIYMGRALSFAAVIVAGRLGMAKSDGDIGVTMVPLDSLDLSHVSILYTQGEMAAITPIYDYNFSILHGTVTVSSWRQLLFWLGPPGLAIAALALLTLDEPRKPVANFLGDVFSSSKFTSPATRDLNRSQRDRFSKPSVAAKATAAAVDEGKEGASIWSSVKDLCGSPVFQAVTFAAAINDVGSWALVSWQATFYQRVYELGPDVYAPALAGILPVGGIIGGVGGGLMGDWLARRGGLQWLTAGATIAAAPVLVGNILAPESTQSFAALLVGFALSEMWRAPAAIMIRDISPPNLGSTGSAVHLCVRNLMGGLGPLGVAFLQGKVGLQNAMLLVPSCYFLSGIGFFFAHRILDSEKASMGSQAAKS